MPKKSFSLQHDDGVLAVSFKKHPTRSDTDKPPAIDTAIEIHIPPPDPSNAQNGTRKSSVSAASNISSTATTTTTKTSTTTGCCGTKKNKQPTVGAMELFRHASRGEIAMMVIGTLMAVASGCAAPLNTIVIGQSVDVYVDNIQIANSTNQTYGHLIVEGIKPVVMYFVYIGIGSMVSSYLAVSLWTLAGERQITRIRKLFFRGVMRQDIGWFDTHEVGQLNSRFSDDMHKVSEGLCDKVPVFIQWFTTTFAAYIVAFFKGWKLTLACFAFSPLFIVATTCTTRLIRNMAVKEIRAYAKAGAVAEQTLRDIRTVQAFQGQEKEEKRYEDNLQWATIVASKKGWIFGIGNSFYWLVMFGLYAAAFYYGVVLIQTEHLESGNILSVFLCLLWGSMALGHAFPNLEAFGNARAAAVKVFEVIELRPLIDVSSPSGKKLENFRGVIEFRNVHFRYPARTEIKVLNGLNLKVNPGKQVALVGPSGCGKSTAIQLLQRFYDPEEGQILLDGNDIRDLNLKWLRDQIGVVSQEPVLFATTIAENIRYGCDGASQRQIEEAARQANAHDFISELPEGYDTLIGERGAQLSGGQKQRIAVARALVRNPRILLLDGATSALDYGSEAVVQAALEKAGVGRTTINVAQRLSTIRYADSIVSLTDGKKEEEGTHDELIVRDGLYAQLVKLQTLAEEETGEEGVVVEIVEADDAEAVEDAKLVKKVVTDSGMIRKLSVRTSLRKTKEGKESVKEEAAKEVKEKKDEEEEDEEEIKKAAKAASLKRLLRLNAPEWFHLLIGIVFSTICGLTYPSLALIVSEFIRVFSLTDPDEQLRKAVTLTIIFAAIGVALAILRVALNVSFAKSGAALISRLRSMAFKSILRQDMSFFDSSENQVGTLTTRLANDAALVQGATGSKIGSLLEAVSTMVASLVVAFVFGWKLALIILAFFPVIVIAGTVQGKVIAGSAQSEKSQLQEAGKICSEAVDNIRTIASINREDIFINKLENLMNEYKSMGLKASQLLGITYALATSIQFFAIATSFHYGTQMVADKEMEFYYVFRVFIAIVFGGAAVGRQSSFSVDYTKGKVAAGRIFTLIDLEPKIDLDKPGETLANYTGQVGVRSVVFYYPTRPTVPVLNELTVAVEPGQTLALVGGSGCGKSTVLQLLQRFYDPHDGAMTIEGRDLRQINLRWFRQQLGIVSQEPTLFDGSIASNIAYGDNTREVPMAEIIAAAKAANVHTFIHELPQGYDTSVGDKSTQLSRGQKQRIAIARALVRQPKVLLLDEATSALDTESERIVQEALDKAREGRTCIVIAHRLSTIQNADKIAVINLGRVQEIGTHSELVKKQGAYYTLLMAQGGGHSKKE